MLTPGLESTAAHGLDDLITTVLTEIDGAAHASIARCTGERLSIVASSDPDIDAALATCDGPSLAAVRHSRVSRIPSTRTCTEFPECSDLCNDLGLHSIGAFPIHGSDRSVIGVLTVTSFDHHGFATGDLRTARRVTAAAVPFLS